MSVQVVFACRLPLMGEDMQDGGNGNELGSMYACSACMSSTPTYVHSERGLPARTRYGQVARGPSHSLVE